MENITGFKGCNTSRQNTDEICSRHVTWKDENKESADPSDDTDDLADVWHKHGDEHGHRYPQDRQHVAAAAFKLRGHCAITPPPPAQQGVLDHRSDDQEGFSSVFEHCLLLILSLWATRLRETTFVFVFFATFVSFKFVIKKTLFKCLWKIVRRNDFF